MKYFSVITACAVTLQLTTAAPVHDQLRKNSAPESISPEILTSRINAPQECLLIREEELCIGGCYWIGDLCTFKMEEGCGFIADGTVCDSDPDCVWLSDARDERQNADAYCANKKEVEDGNCSTAGFVIRSESACNSVKGCSWIDGKKDSGRCSVALTQLQCDVFGSKRKCRQEGCVYKGKNKEKACRGRWEHGFLSNLKGKDGIEAKKAIEAEYGEDTYTVVLLNKGEPKLRDTNRERIILLLNQKGSVKKTPKFG